MEMSFENYMLMVGIRSLEYGFEDKYLFSKTEHFRECYERSCSAYYALLHLTMEDESE
jgi:hypothetical protein